MLPAATGGLAGACSDSGQFTGGCEHGIRRPGSSAVHESSCHVSGISGVFRLDNTQVIFLLRGLQVMCSLTGIILFGCCNPGNGQIFLKRHAHRKCQISMILAFVRVVFLSIFFFTTRDSLRLLSQSLSIPFFVS